MRCIGKTLSNKRCKNKAIPSEEFCRIHMDKTVTSNDKLSSSISIDDLTVTFPTEGRPYILDGRQIIKVDLKLDTKIISSCFYMSTGQNTGEIGRDKWFPFDGIWQNDDSWQFRKLNILSEIDPFLMSNCVATNDSTEQTLCRLGNCYYAFMSYVLGGWKGDEQSLLNKYCNELFLSLAGEVDELQLSSFRSELGNRLHIQKSGSALIPNVGTPRDVNIFIGPDISLNHFYDSYFPNNGDITRIILIEHNKYPFNLTKYINVDGIVPNNEMARRAVDKGLFLCLLMFNMQVDNIILGIERANKIAKIATVRADTIGVVKKYIRTKSIPLIGLL